MSANHPQLFEEWLSLEKAGHTLSYAQIEQVGKAFREAKPSDDVYALARLFPAYFPPTPENVGLLERFLQDEANEQSRKGAVLGASHSWLLAGIDLTLISKIASPVYFEFDDASMWHALSALGSAAVDSSAARQKLLELVTLAKSAEFEYEDDRNFYMQALRESLHVASAGHEAILTQVSHTEKIPSIEESVRVLKSRIGLR